MSIPKEESNHRCGGHCCRCFDLSVSINDLKASIAGTYIGSTGVISVIEDAEKTLDMLVPLGETTDAEVEGKHGLTRLIGQGPAKERYTCKHLQENGDCGVYDSRPHFCRTYPEKHMASCLWKECEASCGIKQMVAAIAEKKGVEPSHG